MLPSMEFNFCEHIKNAKIGVTFATKKQLSTKRYQSSPH